MKIDVARVAKEGRDQRRTPMRVAKCAIARCRLQLHRKLTNLQETTPIYGVPIKPHGGTKTQTLRCQICLFELKAPADQHISVMIKLIPEHMHDTEISTPLQSPLKSRYEKNELAMRGHMNYIRTYTYLKCLLAGRPNYRKLNRGLVPSNGKTLIVSSEYKLKSIRTNVCCRRQKLSKERCQYTS